MMNTYHHPRYPEYVRAIPPTNWAKGAPEQERITSWQKAFDRSFHSMNRNEYSRPVDFGAYLQAYHPDEWIEYAYGPTDKPLTDDFRQKRLGIWKCYGPEHGHVSIHPSEIKIILPWLRLVAGEILERSKNGGINWADVLLCDGGLNLRAHTKAGQEILKQAMAILEPTYREAKP